MDGAMSSPTQFLGIVSGTDWNSIINQLVAVERQPLDKLYTQRSQLQLQQSLTIKANSQLLSLNDALSALRFQSTFLSRKVTASNPSQVDATASVGAATGTYNLSVSRLAAPGRATSGLGGTLFSKVANLSPQQTMGIAGARPRAPCPPRSSRTRSRPASTARRSPKAIRSASAAS
jgi:flagellar hook-associated protein 2